MKMEETPLWKLAAERGPFVRIAGLSGASAVALGAYGAHKKYPKDKVDQLKPIFETANRFHFISSLALLAIPLCRRPRIVSIFQIYNAVFLSEMSVKMPFSPECIVDYPRHNSLFWSLLLPCLHRRKQIRQTSPTWRIGFNFRLDLHDILT